MLCHSIQHRLNIGRRAGDDTQDLTRRSLLLQRFLQLLEQPDVLERDHGLISEGFESLICVGVKGRTSVRRANQSSDEFPALPERNGQECAPGFRDET